MDLQFAHSDLVVAVLSSLLDVLVVAYLIYRVLLLIRGTRAQQILMGLGVIAFAFFASRVLKLNTLSWILENFIGSFLLIVIVLFQIYWKDNQRLDQVLSYTYQNQCTDQYQYQLVYAH